MAVKLPQTVESELRQAGSATVRTSEYLTQDLRRMADAAREAGATLVIRDDGDKLVQDLREVADHGGQNVAFAYHNRRLEQDRREVERHKSQV